MAYQVLQTKRFSRAYKKLHESNNSHIKYMRNPSESYGVDKIC